MPVILRSGGGEVDPVARCARPPHPPIARAPRPPPNLAEKKNRRHRAPTARPGFAAPRSAAPRCARPPQPPIAPAPRPPPNLAEKKNRRRRAPTARPGFAAPRSAPPRARGKNAQRRCKRYRSRRRGIPSLGEARPSGRHHHAVSRGASASHAADDGRNCDRKNSTIIFAAQFMTTVQEAIAMLTKDSTSR